MRRDMAAHAGMIGIWLAALPKPKQDVNKKHRPPDEQRRHEPVTKFKNMIDLVAVSRSVGRLTQKLVDQCKAIHTCSGLPRLALDGVRPACGHDATHESCTRRFHQGPTSQRQKETTSRQPCARSICRPSRRNKTDTLMLVVPQTERIPTLTRRPFSRDDAQPLHFPVKPNAIHEEHYRNH